MPTFDEASALVEAALTGGTRQEILDGLAQARSQGEALTRLRAAMCSHTWKAGSTRIDLQPVVDAFDHRNRKDGFHILHDWDGKAAHVNEDLIAVEVLDYVAARRHEGPVDRASLAILIDYYFLYVLALLAIRIWDGGEPDDHLDRLGALIAHLRGPDGSGQPFARDAGSIFLLVGSHFEPEDRAYDRLLEKVKTLDRRHQLAIAEAHARSLGSHLRFGFEATYGRDIRAMRDDNGVDYTWLCYSLLTVLDDYERLRAGDASTAAARDVAVETLVSGLTADTAAFIDQPMPACLSGAVDDRAALFERLQPLRQEIADVAQRHRPSDRGYSPIALFYNFCQNVVKGIVVDALLWGEPWRLSLEDLLTATPEQAPGHQGKLTLARTLMGYARSSPDTIRGRLMPAIVYDPAAGRRAFGEMIRCLAPARPSA